MAPGVRNWLAVSELGSQWMEVWSTRQAAGRIPSPRARGLDSSLLSPVLCIFLIRLKLDLQVICFWVKKYGGL
jgi:hypothetical protein